MPRDDVIRDGMIRDEMGNRSTTRIQRGLMLLDFTEMKILFTTVKDNLVQYCLLCMAV
jgi:hypothetical protein